MHNHVCLFWLHIYSWFVCYYFKIQLIALLLRKNYPMGLNKCSQSRRTNWDSTSNMQLFIDVVQRRTPRSRVTFVCWSFTVSSECQVSILVAVWNLQRSSPKSSRRIFQQIASVQWKYKYTHLDLETAHMVGLSMELIQYQQTNFLKCRHRRQYGRRLFGKTIDYLFVLKRRMKERNPINSWPKEILSSLWGSICEKKKVVKISYAHIEILKIKNAMVLSLTPDEGGGHRVECVYMPLTRFLSLSIC